MSREQAWNHYFNTGDREPLVKAYWDSISYLAWANFPYARDDYFQVGMLGLLKAIDRIDPKRVKSKDAWVWLNVKGMMKNVVQPTPTVSLNELMSEKSEYIDQLEDKADFIARIDLLDAAATDDPAAYLDNYRSQTIDHKTVLERYNRGELSLRALGNELGISRRAAYKLVGQLPASW